MWRQKMPMSRSLFKVATATTDEIVDDPVQSGHLMAAQRIAYKNQNNATTKIKYLKRGRGVDFLLSETNTATANQLYTDIEPVYFTEGEQLVVRFEGCQVGDNLSAFVTGWIAAGSGAPVIEE